MKNLTDSGLEMFGYSEIPKLKNSEIKKLKTLKSSIIRTNVHTRSEFPKKEFQN